MHLLLLLSPSLPLLLIISSLRSSRFPWNYTHIRHIPSSLLLLPFVIHLTIRFNLSLSLCVSLRRESKSVSFRPYYYTHRILNLIRSTTINNCFPLIAEVAYKIISIHINTHTYLNNYAYIYVYWDFRPILCESLSIDKSLNPEIIVIVLWCNVLYPATVGEVSKSEKSKRMQNERERE